MALVSVAVEENGWVLAVRGPWTATPGAWEFSGFDRTEGRFTSSGVDQFPLTPSATPKIELTVQDAGFDRVGGLPVANANRPRTVIGTKALRRPHPDQTQLDETDHGDGTRTVRIALSDRIYSTSTVVAVSFLSGWKVGEGGGVINLVTNNSTRAVPLPIFRWANEPWPLVRGAIGTPNHTARVEVLIATHHPENAADVDGQRHNACAALLLRAYDGTTTKDFYFSAPQTSTLYADNLRCWGGNIDLSGLSAGPITVHATVYPWVGAARATGTAHSTDVNAALQSGFNTPFHIYYDPTGETMPVRYMVVDPASTNTLPFDAGHQANIVLYTTEAAALASPVSARPGTLAACAPKLATIGTWTARNGFAAVTNCAAYSELIVLGGAGNAVVAPAAAVGSGSAQVTFGYVIIRGDATDPNPRANCIFRSGTAAAVRWANLDRTKFKDLRMELGGQTTFAARSGIQCWATMENCTVTSRSGQSASTSTIYVNTDTRLSAFNATMFNYAGQPRCWFQRNVNRTRGNDDSNTSCQIGVTFATPAGGDHAPVRTGVLFSGGAANVNDMMIWNCRAFNWAGLLFQGGLTNFGSGIALERVAIINSVFESTGGPALTFGESFTNAQLRDSIFEGVVMAGSRFNLHNDSEVHGTAASCAMRVGNSPNTSVIVGFMAHGLSTGDTITVSGLANANMNRTNVTVTAMDVNRFSYSAAAAVTTGSSGLPLINVLTGARAGQSFLIIRENMRHTGNVFRYSSFNRNATKHDTFNGAGHLTGSWEVLYGVGYRGNVNANRGISSPPDFQYAFYGIGSETETAFGGGTQTDVASWLLPWHGYVADNAPSGPENAAPTYNGDYRADAATVAPYKPSRLLNKGTAAGPAVTDRDANNNVRGLTFDAGGLGRMGAVVPAILLLPDDASSLHVAGSSQFRWTASLAPLDGSSSSAAGSALLTLRPPPAEAADVTARLIRVTSESRILGVETE
jgi:hypothetical protein